MSAVWLAIGLIVLACVAFYWWTQVQKAAKQRMQDQVLGRKPKLAVDGNKLAPAGRRGMKPSSHPLALAIAPMLARNDWDGARRYLQKVAYGVANASEAEKLEFKAFMMYFAAADPLYSACMRAISPIISSQPNGIKQTALYPHMAAAQDTETARYVLYYADALGHVQRVKKGNSFMVYAPGQAIPALEPAAKRKGRKA